MRIRLLASLILIGVAAGCASVGPDYKRVPPPVPQQFGSLEKGISTADPAACRAPHCLVEDI